MNDRSIELVQNTFAQVAPIADKAAALFYARLFEIAPEVRPLFKADLTEQGAKLMQMIGTAVASLTNLDALVPVAQDLAKRHIDYGVKKEHYAVVGAALIWTLEQGLGDAFTEEVKQAWVDVYGLLSSVMIDAAYD
ncbi:hemoprotein [Catenovulum agarivorans DS-2]|uniref:Hemoprotein n=1 Tax=Catenovulum agarivorans DS-2 TaxID=1328313 RepID=W7R3G1_9ALTE|nr:globin family protein [Catenovulum agarivorans]EWH12165.1 hemoprotein [Catenovulum agarivorans DS-2]